MDCVRAFDFSSPPAPSRKRKRKLLLLFLTRVKRAAAPPHKPPFLASICFSGTERKCLGGCGGLNKMAGGARRRSESIDRSVKKKWWVGFGEPRRGPAWFFSPACGVHAVLRPGPVGSAPQQRGRKPRPGPPVNPSMHRHGVPRPSPSTSAPAVGPAVYTAPLGSVFRGVRERRQSSLGTVCRWDGT